MSNPANKADTQEEQGTKNGLAFADRVNEAVKAATVDEEGNLVLPDDLPEEVKFAATAEKRRRDTQSAYTKETQKTKALEAEKSTLLNKLNSSVKVELTTEQAEELEELKFSDPEAWRTRMNTYEAEARAKRTEEIDNDLKQVSAGTLEKEELEQRKQTLQEFQSAHPDFELTDAIIANDIPPRISKKLETGAISFEAFLQECYDFVTTGKVVKQEPNPKRPNMGKFGGGSSPDRNATIEDSITTYKNEVY